LINARFGQPLIVIVRRVAETLSTYEYPLPSAGHVPVAVELVEHTHQGPAWVHALGVFVGTRVGLVDPGDFVGLTFGVTNGLVDPGALKGAVVGVTYGLDEPGDFVGLTLGVTNGLCVGVPLSDIPLAT